MLPKWEPCKHEDLHLSPQSPWHRGGHLSSGGRARRVPGVCWPDLVRDPDSENWVEGLRKTLSIDLWCSHPWALSSMHLWCSHTQVRTPMPVPLAKITVYQGGGGDGKEEEEEEEKKHVLKLPALSTSKRCCLQ